MDYIVHGILQARILEWVAFPFSRGSSQPRDRTQVSHIAGGFFTSWATRKPFPVYRLWLNAFSGNRSRGCFSEEKDKVLWFLKGWHRGISPCCYNLWKINLLCTKEGTANLLENPMDRGAWQATAHRVAKSWTDWSNLAHTHTPLVPLGEFSPTERTCVVSTQIKKHCYQTRASSLHYLLRVKGNLLKVGPLQTSNRTDWSSLFFISIYRIFQYVLFFSWFLSLSISSMRFIHIVVYRLLIIIAL